MSHHKKIIELSNNLTLSDMEILINCFSQNIFVYNREPEYDGEPIYACLNGHSIQITNPHEVTDNE